jgi:hypothetical protein
MILNFLFVPIDLLLDLVDRQVDGRVEFFMPLFRHKIVLVLGVDANFNFLERSILQIHRDLDHGDPAEEVKQFLGLLGNVLLMFFIQMSMPGRDFHLHGVAPPRQHAVTSKSSSAASLGGR